MKKIIKTTVIFAISLYLCQTFWQNLIFQNGLQTYLLVAFILTILEKFAKPILKILLLPINILTLGFFRFFVNVIALYAVTFFINSFQIQAINITRLPILNFGPLSFNLLFSYLISAFSLYLCYSILRKFLK